MSKPLDVDEVAVIAMKAFLHPELFVAINEESSRLGITAERALAIAAYDVAEAMGVESAIRQRVNIGEE